MTVYISEAHLTRAARALTRDPYAMHRTLTFAAQVPRVMWALPAPGVLIAQAEVPLRPAALPGIVDYVAAREKPTRFAAGTRVELGGIVNPTEVHGRVYPPGYNPDTDRRPRARRRALQPERWPEWAGRKLGDAVHIEHLDMRDHGVTHGSKPGARITISLAAMHAVATVRDPDALEAILIGGVGAAKAFGAGLILCKELS